MNLQASICLRFYFEDHSKKIFSDANDLTSKALYENLFMNIYAKLSSA